MKKKFDGLLILFLFIIFIIVMIFAPFSNSYQNYGNLIINEIMPVNNNTILDYYGNYSDYIELYNGNDYDINLEGYYLSDDSSDTRKWSFPSVTIKANDYLIIYASGKDTFIEKELHTNFKLNSKGENVILSDNTGEIISRIYSNNTSSDIAYGFNGTDYVYYYNGTPLMLNSGDYSDKPIIKETSSIDLVITEYMTNNLNVVKSNDGKYYSVIEIYNNMDKDVNLKGFYLTDKTDNITKYKFPNVTIGAKDYLIVYTSGKDTFAFDEVHTNFSLNNSDGVLILSNPHKVEIDKVYIRELDNNLSYGLYKDSWYKYNKTTFGKENTSDYLKDGEVIKDIVINEVSAIGTEAIELKNISDNDINLSNYSIGDKSGYTYKLPNVTLKKNSYIILYASDKASFSNNKIYVGFHINNSTELIYLYKNNVLIDEFNVNRLVSNVSVGLNENGERVYFKNKTFGKKNSSDYFLGYSEVPKYSINGGYVEKGTKISLETGDNSTIYYTLDGSFPSNKSTKYTGEITINKTSVLKAISYKDGYLESEIVSRTFIVGREHDLPIVSISANDNSFFGSNGLLTNYMSNAEKKISFEFYESDGTLGVSFIGATKLTGADSRKQPQKSMGIYLRKEYGLQEVTYPFFKEGDTTTYSSFVLRNAGEDPKRVRIQDTALTYALKGQMDIDIQDYRAVVVYINGKYYGLYNMREKLNGDYVESVYGIDKDNFDLIKYGVAQNGTNTEFKKLVNYVKTHNCVKTDVYEYLKTQIDIQELCNYMVAITFYANTDAGNIRYWKSDAGKWRFMLYDLDWSLYYSTVRMSYPFIYGNYSPVVTYDGRVMTLTRNLYKNKEFKDLYLKTLAYHLKNTFKPERMNSIIDTLASEIENEMPYHIKRWGNSYPTLNSMSRWQSNLKGFKNSIKKRYNAVLGRLKSDFNLSNAEYKKYFGDL